MKVKDGVRFKGFVKTISTGEFTIELKEFFVDGEWYKLKTAMPITVGAEAYSENLTTDELDYIKKKVDADVLSTKLTEDEKTIIDSILKKIPVLIDKSAEDEVVSTPSTDSGTSGSTSSTDTGSSEVSP